MNFSQFADLMESIGFKNDESVNPVFKLSNQDLQDSVFKNAYSKRAGLYRVVSLWSQEGEVALWAREEMINDAKRFPFYKEEVDFLAQKMKFKKNY